MGYMDPFALATLVASRLDLTMKVIWRGNTSGSARKIKGSGFSDSGFLIPQPRQLGPYHSLSPDYRGWDSWKWLGQKGPSCLGDLRFNRDEMVVVGCLLRAVVSRTSALHFCFRAQGLHKGLTMCGSWLDWGFRVLGSELRV